MTNADRLFLGISILRNKKNVQVFQAPYEIAIWIDCPVSQSEAEYLESLGWLFDRFCWYFNEVDVFKEDYKKLDIRPKFQGDLV